METVFAVVNVPICIQQICTVLPCLRLLIVQQQQIYHPKMRKLDQNLSNLHFGSHCSSLFRFPPVIPIAGWSLLGLFEILFKFAYRFNCRILSYYESNMCFFGTFRVKLVKMERRFVLQLLIASWTVQVTTQGDVPKCIQ